jgi:hypothetical protein
MARQVGKAILVGTKSGCTGYVMEGNAYIRRRSSLDGDRWRKDAAFARSRAASVTFGAASTFVSGLWRGVPKSVKRLMGEGAYQRLSALIRCEVFGDAADGLGSEFSALGGLGASGLDMVVQRSYSADGSEVLRVRGLEGLASLYAAGTVRVRLHAARVEATPVRWCQGAGKFDLLPLGGRERVSAVSSWQICGGDDDGLEVVLPEFTGELCCYTFLCLEVAVKGSSGRWKRLAAACQGFVAGMDFEIGERSSVRVRLSVRGRAGFRGSVRAANLCENGQVSTCPYEKKALFEVFRGNVRRNVRLRASFLGRAGP